MLLKWCQDPFRPLFSIGILLGLAGVTMWMYPHDSFFGTPTPLVHAYLMSNGFLLAFVLGFFATAIPKHLDTKAISPIALVLFMVSFIVGLVAASLGRMHVTTAILTLQLSLCLIFLLPRYYTAKERFIAPFALFAIGTLLGLIGSIWMLIENRNPLAVDLAREAMFLCFVCGVGGFLLPKLLHAPAPSRPTGSLIKYITTGCLIGISYVVEYHVAFFAGTLLRAIIVTFVIFSDLPMLRPPKSRPIHVQLAWLALWLLIIALFMFALVPQYTLAALHLMYIGGYSVLIFSIGLQIYASHNQATAALQQHHRRLAIIFAATLTSVGVRMSANHVHAYSLLILIASCFWSLAAFLWWHLAVYGLKKSMQNQTESPSKKN